MAVMPRTRTPRWLLAVALATCLGLPELCAQRPRGGGGFGSVGGSNSLFSLSRSQDDIHEWR